MSQPYIGRAAESAARAKANKARRGPSAQDRIKSALYWLNSEHVQQNKYRMGALGAQEIDNAIAVLTK